MKSYKKEPSANLHLDTSARFLRVHRCVSPEEHAELKYVSEKSELIFQKSGPRRYGSRIFPAKTKSVGIVTPKL